LLRGWTSEKRGSKQDKTKTVRRSYSRDTVKGWFRVFRTMTRDAMATLELPRDPTLRITMPEDTGDVDEANSLSPAQLAAFLTAMRTRYPQHYALVVLLAYTGLRFCHASALHWQDWEEAGGVLRISRKQVRGKVGSSRERSGRRRSTRSSPSSRRSSSSTACACSRSRPLACRRG
jgi:integrase